MCLTELPQQGVPASVIVARTPGTALQPRHSTILTGVPPSRVFWYNTFFYIYKTIYAVRCHLIPFLRFPGLQSYVAISCTCE